MTFNCILCPVDFSSRSHEALRVASELARESKATLVIAHVVEARTEIADVLVELTSPSAESEEAHRKRDLAAWKAEAGKLGATEVKTRLLSGIAAWEQIVDTAKKDGCDLIVISTHGRTGLARVLIGSVAENIVRHASCSVLVVRAPGHKRAISR